MTSMHHRQPRQRSHRLLKRFLRGCYRLGTNIRTACSQALRRFLRTCYHLGRATCIFCGCVLLFLIVAVVLLITVPNARKAQTAQQGDIPITAPQTTFNLPEAARTGEDAAEPAGLTDPATAAPADTPTPVPEPTPEPTPIIQFEKYDEGEEIIALQERLMELGYMAADEPTDYFGPATKFAVQLFQRQHDLQQDGIVGNQTYDLLMSKDAKPYVMYEGAEGKDIKAFQEMLYDLGYLRSSQITGYYGTDTIAAVQAFQKRNHLTQDGKAGEKTIEAINDADARPSAEREKEIAAEKKKAEEEAAKKSVSGRINTLIQAAEKQLGKPYVLGDRGPDSFDCSGLVWYCLKQADVYTRCTNAAGYSTNSSWKKITDMDDLKKGDLIFFKSDSSDRVSHVGIYIGSGTMIDASSSEGKVVKRSCRGSWSKRNFVCGRRPIS